MRTSQGRVIFPQGFLDGIMKTPYNRAVDAFTSAQTKDLLNNQSQADMARI
jgi:hypothetical protein